MKCTGLLVGGNSVSLYEFVGSEQANTPLGKILIALVQETAWSGEYTVSAVFNEKPHLTIGHETFLPGRPLIISDETGAGWTVRRVEDAVRAHIRDSKESLQPDIDRLQAKANNLWRTSEQIAMDKAKTATVAVFPEAINATSSAVLSSSGLYVLIMDMHKGPLFVARELDKEFVGGVVRIDCNASYWYGLKDGIEKNQRHGVFWAELARAFAARELGIPEKDLWCESVSAIEKPWEESQVDPYVVGKVVLRDGPVERVVVEFGPNNLPAKAYRTEGKPAEPRPVNRSLIDKHMTP